MATKKKTGEKAEETTDEGVEEEAPPDFEFPTDFYGNEWQPISDKMLYWTRWLGAPFNFDGTTHEEGWAVVSDIGEKEIYSAQDFSEKFVPVLSQPMHEPVYLEREKQAAAAAEAEAAKDDDAKFKEDGPKK